MIFAQNLEETLELIRELLTLHGTVHEEIATFCSPSRTMAFIRASVKEKLARRAELQCEMKRWSEFDPTV